MRRRPTALLASVVALCVLAVAAAAAPAATTRSCGSISNPYPGTRFAGEPLSHITATGVSCATARSVTRSAHRRALGMTPSPTGIRTFTWNGWKVTGDLRPAHDRYVATRGTKHVRWRF
jgi:hypothetical protein